MLCSKNKYAGLFESLQFQFFECIDYGSRYGEVSEWLIEPVSKTGVRHWRTAGSNPALSVESANPALAGFEPQKGVGKEFSHVVGVTGAKRRQRGRAPMEIRLCGFGFQSRPLRYIG
jgi:hypothetical protein